MALVWSACAEVPASVCFSNEACADAGTLGGGTGGSLGGGGGGGSAAGGGSETGGGSGGALGGGGGGAPIGGGGGGMDGLDAGPPVVPLYASLGIFDRWADIESRLSTTLSPPAFTMAEVPLPSALTTLDANCPEAFRGAVALPDGRVMAIPFCADRFAVIDPALQTTQWVGPTLPSPSQQSEPAGSYGGGVLGCDGNVYALPYRSASMIRRLTPLSNGTFEIKDLPLSDGSVHSFSGGVVAHRCAVDFLIIAAGADGLYALAPTQDTVTVTRLTVPAAMGRRFVGVARLGDAQVISAPAHSSTTNDELTLVVNTLTLAVTSSASSLPPDSFGVATVAGDRALSVTEGGTAHVSLSDGSGVNVRTTPGARMRWPTSSQSGWVFGSGDSLMAYRATGTLASDDALLFDPAVSDNGAFTSGGLVLAPNGVLVNVPGVTTRSVITLYVPTTVTTDRGVALSPWFNKL